MDIYLPVSSGGIAVVFRARYASKYHRSPGPPPLHKVDVKILVQRH